MKAFFKNLFVFAVAPIVVAAILVITIGSQFGSAWILLLILFGLGIVLNIQISKFMTNTVYTVVMIALIMSTVGSWGITQLGNTLPITKYVMPEAIQGKDLKIAAKIDEPLVDAKTVIFMDQREREKRIAKDVAILIKQGRRNDAIALTKDMGIERAEVDELINPSKPTGAPKGTKESSNYKDYPFGNYEFSNMKLNESQGMERGEVEHFVHFPENANLRVELDGDEKYTEIQFRTGPPIQLWKGEHITNNNIRNYFKIVAKKSGITVKLSIIPKK